MASPFDPGGSGSSNSSKGDAGSADAQPELEEQELEERTLPFQPPITLESPELTRTPAPSTARASRAPRRPEIVNTRISPRVRLESRLRRGKRELERGFRQGARFIDAQRAKLPVGLKKALEPVPSEALFGLAIAIPCFLLGVGAVFVTLTGTPDAETTLVSKASAPRGLDARSKRAVDVKGAPSSFGETGGEPEPVSAETDEGAVLLSLAESLSAQGRAKQALGVLDRLLTRRPELRSERRVAQVLTQTVNTEENATFALLEEAMGEAGAAIVYELAMDRETRGRPKQRAEAWLKSKAFDRSASLPLYALVKLRLANGCEEKRALLGLAIAGGQQTLDYLRELEARTACAPNQRENCYPCLREDPRLSHAIAGIQKRLGG